MEIKDKKIIVTGAASGVGKALVKNLINRGAYVFGLDISKDNLNLLEEEVKSEKLKTFVVDISNKDNLNKFKEDYFKDNKEIDILINNAGIIQPFKNVVELDDATIDRVMNVNFYGAMNLTRLFLKELIENPKGGYIVNVSSMGGFFPFPGQTVYGASKAALKNFTEGLYAELSNTKVKVMIVLPGAMNTGIMKNSLGTTNGMDASNSSVKMLGADDAASAIIDGIMKDKFKLFVGSDSKFMKFIYKLNSKWAIDFINKKMSSVNK